MICTLLASLHRVVMVCCLLASLHKEVICSFSFFLLPYKNHLKIDTLLDLLMLSTRVHGQLEEKPFKRK